MQRGNDAKTATTQAAQQPLLDIPIDSKQTIDELIRSRCAAPLIVPELVTEQEVRHPLSYNRFRELDVKDAFRKKLLETLAAAFEKSHGKINGEKITAEFKKLAAALEANGAVIFGSMINISNFQNLINMYTENLSTTGSKSWIHSYINLGNHPEFLSNDNFNGAFAHPLLLTLIAYAAGGPIRMVDARGKDAEPLAVQAQDNMLHIDNTPFRKEFKIILTWERGKPSGPKGQNFVFIPGTHKGVRNCYVTNNQAWSTEDGSIFTSEASIQKMFDLQTKMLGGQSPSVIEATHPTMPLTTVFEAGALVHHRYRTKEKNVERSCVIVAFHRAKDNPGQLLSPEHVDKAAPKGSLLHLLMGKHSDNTDEAFINAVVANCELIAAKIVEVGMPNDMSFSAVTADMKSQSQIVSFTTRDLKEEELKKWKATVTSAPTVEAIKQTRAYFNLGEKLSHGLLTEMMRYDKHGPLDLILYGDGHEEIRKWARNRIREMPVSRLESRLKKFAEHGYISPPDIQELLTPVQLNKIAKDLVALLDKIPTEAKGKGFLDKQEKISSPDAFRSLRQLIDDLGEAILRCTSRQTFLSTSLFLLLAADELSYLKNGPEAKPEPELLNLIKALFANYLTTYIAIEKQIAFDKISELNHTLTDKTKTAVVDAKQAHPAHGAFFQKQNTQQTPDSSATNANDVTQKSHSPTSGSGK